MAAEDCLGSADKRQRPEKGSTGPPPTVPLEPNGNTNQTMPNTSNGVDISNQSSSHHTKTPTTNKSDQPPPTAPLLSPAVAHGSSSNNETDVVRRRSTVVPDDATNTAGGYISNNSNNTYNMAATGGDAGTSSVPTTTSMPTSINAREYAQVVRTWLWQYHQWSSMCAFSMMLPYYAMATFPYYAATYTGSLAPRSNSASSTNAVPTTTGPTSNNNNNNIQGPAARGIRGVNRVPAQAPPQQTPQRPPQAAAPHLRATEYIIPSLWKRILAELVDFVLLFYIKLVVSVMVMKHMGYIDLEKYDLEYNWFVAMDEFDISKVFHFTSEVILFELLNRISITIVETMCLRRGIGVVGGATPGKRLLGMKVVSCTDILDLGNGRIQVTPARDIGLYSALLRSILKNFTIAFFFPACLTVFFFDHNRAAYDVLAGSIVVQPVDEAGEL